MIHARLARLTTLTACLWIALRPGVSVAAAAQAPLEEGTEAWDGLLKKHVTPRGGVDYAGFQTDRSELKAFIKLHAQLTMKGDSDDVKKATYLNFYNAVMIDQLLTYAADRNLTPGSPDFLALTINTIHIPGGNIWNGDRTANLAGHEVTLDTIEHQLLRGQETPTKLLDLKVSTLDPRLHAAANCAAISCPRLRHAAYRSATIDQDLEAAMSEFLSDDQQFHNDADDRLKANSIVFWYYSDFDSHGKTIGKAGAGDYLAGFVQPKSPEASWKVAHLKAHFNDRSKFALKLSSAFTFAYDWHVNDRANKP